MAHPNSNEATHHPPEYRPTVGERLNNPDHLKMLGRKGLDLASFALLPVALLASFSNDLAAKMELDTSALGQYPALVEAAFQDPAAFRDSLYETATGEGSMETVLWAALFAGGAFKLVASKRKKTPDLSPAKGGPGSDSILPPSNSP